MLFKKSDSKTNIEVSDQVDRISIKLTFENDFENEILIHNIFNLSYLEHSEYMTKDQIINANMTIYITESKERGFFIINCGDKIVFRNYRNFIGAELSE